MEIKATDGTRHNIDPVEERRIYNELDAKMHHPHAAMKHSFSINGTMVALSVEEMKVIADAWWENYGKSRMEEFFEEYRDRAGNNIAEALGCSHAPESEKQVKGAIAMALASNNPDLAAEVIFEAMEWQTAYAGLKSILDED